MRVGVYMLVWNAILAKLMDEQPDQSFDDINLKGLPFHHTNHIVSTHGQPYILILTMRLFWLERVGGKIVICTKERLELVNMISLQNSWHSTQPFSSQLVLHVTAYLR